MKLDVLGSLKRRLYPAFARVQDFIVDRSAAERLARLQRSTVYTSSPARSILVVGVQSDRRPGSIERIVQQIRETRHHIVADSKGIDGIGKLDNINILIDRNDLTVFDWVWMIDDDVELPNDFTNIMVALAEYADLALCGPAHRSHSFWSHPVTHREKATLVRYTNFVEVGPITCVRRDLFGTVFPLPSLRYGWGIDVVWPVIAERMGLKVGVIDGAALRHTSPIGTGYDVDQAVREAEDFMAQYGIKTGVHEIRTTGRITAVEDAQS